MSLVPAIAAGEVRAVLRHEVDAVRSNWIWLLILGIALIVLGTFAIAAPWVFTTAAVTALGILLMASGAAQMVAAFWSRNWSGFFFCLLTGIFYLVVGFIFIRKPASTAAALTLMIAAFLMVGGIFKIVTAIVYRFGQWGWVIVSGVITLVLGDLVLSDWPESSLWVIGIFLGVDLIFNGWAWVMMSLALKKLPQASV